MLLVLRSGTSFLVGLYEIVHTHNVDTHMLTHNARTECAYKDNIA